MSSEKLKARREEVLGTNLGGRVQGDESNGMSRLGEKSRGGLWVGLSGDVEKSLGGECRGRWGA